MQISDEMVEKAARVMARLDAGDRRDLAEVVDYVEGRWPRYVREAKQILTAALTAALAGHVVVPREPTPEMLDAGGWAIAERNGDMSPEAEALAQTAYRAMIDAASQVSRGE